MIKGKFELKSSYSPAGDQPSAIQKLCEGLDKNSDNQVELSFLIQKERAVLGFSMGFNSKCLFWV